MRSGWKVSYRTSIPSLVNVVPEDDIFEHRCSPRCGCQPQVERLHDGPHMIGRLITHRRVV